MFEWLASSRNQAASIGSLVSGTLPDANTEGLLKRPIARRLWRLRAITKWSPSGNSNREESEKRFRNYTARFTARLCRTLLSANMPKTGWTLKRQRKSQGSSLFSVGNLV